MLKKIISLVLILTVIFALSVSFTSCKKDKDDKDDDKTPEVQNPDPDKKPVDDGKTTYTVTVTDEDGNAIEGVEITFHFAGGTNMPFDTDENGVVSQKLSSKVQVSVTEIPAGYEFNKLNAKLDFDANGNLSVVLTVPAPYVILVVDQHGSPVAGVRVQACDDIGCRPPRTTDAEGKAYYPYEDTNLHAQISELIPGYSVEDITQYYEFDGDRVAKIVINKD